MKKIITALANPELTEEIIKTKKYEIISPDIQYQDGVLEIFENNQNIDFLILNSILPGERNLKDFITKVKEKNPIVEIIIILEKENKEIENFLISKGVFKIFYNNQITIEELIKQLEQDMLENRLNEEIKILKEIILNNNKNIKKDISNKINIIFKLKKEIKKILNKIKHKKINKTIYGKEETNKIISISGTINSGKSIFTIITSTLMDNKKILIIDLNIENSSINTMFQIKKYNNKIINTKQNSLEISNNYSLIYEKTIKISHRISVLCYVDMFFDNRNKFNMKTFQGFISQIRNKYDYIFIDMSSNINNEYNKNIFKLADQMFFLSEANITQLQKTKILLNQYINKFEIPVEKIKIIINKYNKKSIDKSILKKIFMDFEILGGIAQNDQYDFLLNNNNLIKNIKNLNKKIKKEYLIIINKFNF